MGFLRQTTLKTPSRFTTLQSLHIFFTDALKIETEQEVKRCNISLFRQFFHGMLREGIYLAPSAYEVGFISAAHREFEIEKTLTAAEKVFAGLVL